MKKLSLKTSDLQRGEVLTRQQLKNVLGGDGSGSGEEDTPCTDTDECTNAGGTCGADDKGKCETYGCGSGKLAKEVKYCIMPI
jgi:hypothetical protein